MHAMRRALVMILFILLFLPVRSPADALPQKSQPVPDVEPVMEQFDDALPEIRAEEERIAARKNLPCVYILTENRQAVLSGDEYVPAVVDVFNCDPSMALTAPGGLKVRGNSTADQGDEKPYRIKFLQKQNLLGLHEGKKYKSWVLMRSYWNLVPDYTGFQLARTIFEGKYYVSDSIYVNLYLNGSYRGLYLLCEQNQAAKGRVEVHQPKAGDASLLTGYMIELDNYPSDEHPHFLLEHEKATVKDIAGTEREMSPADYSIKSDINTTEQMEFIHRYTEGVFRILFEASEHGLAMVFDEGWQVVPAERLTPREAVEKVINTDSLACMLILDELVHDNDVGEGSFFMAVDFTADSLYPRLTFLAPWDFNWGYEEPSDGGYYASTFQPVKMEYDRSNVWYILAMKMDWFREQVMEKWTALSRSGALTETTARIEMTRLALQPELETDGWRFYSAGDLIRFVNGRIAWLNRQWLKN